MITKCEYCKPGEIDNQHHWVFFEMTDNGLFQTTTQEWFTDINQAMAYGRTKSFTPEAAEQFKSFALKDLEEA
jgi:hypothetical protein